MLEPPAAVFKLKGDLASSKAFPPFTVGELVKIANQGVGNAGVIMQIPLDLSPVLTKVVVSDL
jgi:hypothetical protein